MQNLKRFVGSSLLAALLVAGSGVFQRSEAQCRVVGYRTMCIRELLSGGYSCAVVPVYECTYVA
jgi:hypothetical protein